MNTMKLKKMLLVLIMMTIWVAAAAAEEIRNDSGCDVCPGAIYFSTEESTEILGEELKAYALDWWWRGQRTVWIDLDGVFKDSELPENKAQFELQIYGSPDRIYIKSLLDGSLLELICYPQEAREAVASGGEATWSPEIFLFAGHSGAIDLEDSMDVAWGKLKETHIYQWASRGKDLREKPGEMRVQVSRAMKALAPVKVNVVHSR